MINHASDCAVHNMPANVPGDCDCGATGDTAPDPTEIDLDDLIKDLRRAASMYSAPGAAALLYRTIAAVEALRERVAELEQSLDDPALPDSWYARAEAAEAHVVELVGALEEVRPYFEGEHHYDHPSCKVIRTALAAKTPEALERSRARDEVITTARCIAECRAYQGGHRGVEEALRSDIAALDALQGEPTP